MSRLIPDVLQVLIEPRHSKPQVQKPTDPIRINGRPVQLGWERRHLRRRNLDSTEDGVLVSVFFHGLTALRAEVIQCGAHNQDQVLASLPFGKVMFYALDESRKRGTRTNADDPDSEFVPSRTHQQAASPDIHRTPLTTRRRQRHSQGGRTRARIPSRHRASLRVRAKAAVSTRTPMVTAAARSPSTADPRDARATLSTTPHHGSVSARTRPRIPTSPARSATALRGSGTRTARGAGSRPARTTPNAASTARPGRSSIAPSAARTRARRGPLSWTGSAARSARRGPPRHLAAMARRRRLSARSATAARRRTACRAPRRSMCCQMRWPRATAPSA